MFPVYEMDILFLEARVNGITRFICITFKYDSYRIHFGYIEKMFSST